MGIYGNRIININHAPTGIDCQPVSWRLTPSIHSRNVWMNGARTWNYKLLACIHNYYKLQITRSSDSDSDKRRTGALHQSQRHTLDALFRRISPVVLDAQTNFTPASDAPMQFISEPRPVLTLNDTVNCLQSFS